AAVAAGEAAAAVAGFERAALAGGDGTAPAAERELSTALLEQLDDGGVAGEAACGLGGERGTVGEVAAAGRVAREGVRVDVDDDLTALRPAPLAAGRTERELGQRDQ